MYSFSEAEIEQQVLHFMHQCGIEPRGNLRIERDGTIHRFSVQDDHGGEKSGAYCIYPDEWPAGWVRDWRLGDSHNWSFPREALSQQGKDYWTDERYKQAYERSKKLQEQRQKELQEKNRKASEQARDFFMKLPEAPNLQTPYLQKKGIKPYGLKFDKVKQAIVIPMYNADGIIQSVQTIDKNGNKGFFGGAPIKGAFFPIGFETLEFQPKQIILIGEGLATMSTINQLLDSPEVACAAALTCHNIKPVCAALKARYPYTSIIVTADNDAKTPSNPGLTAANEARKSLNLQGVVYPEFDDEHHGSDWNDYALAYGLDKAKEVLRAQIRKTHEPPEPPEPPKTQETTNPNSNNRSRHTYSHRSFAECCRSAKPIDYLVQGYIQKAGLEMLYGESEAKKSFLALDLAASIACTDITSWHGLYLEHGPVIYMAGEGGEGINLRTKAWALKRGINPENVQLELFDEVFHLDDDDDPDHDINKTIEEIRYVYDKPVLIVIDTLHCFMDGDESKAVDAASILNVCRKLIRTFGCAVLLIHHVGVNQDAKNRARGSSSFRAAMDIELKVSCSGSVVTLSQTKNKDAKKEPDRFFNLESVIIPGLFDKSGQQVTSLVPELNESPLLEQNGKKAVKLNRSEIFARKTFTEAVRRAGFVIKDSDTGHKLAAVEVEDWRNVFYELSTADSDSTKRNAFKRARASTAEIGSEHRILEKRVDEGREIYCLDITKSNEPPFAFEVSCFLSARPKTDGSPQPPADDTAQSSEGDDRTPNLFGENSK